MLNLKSLFALSSFSLFLLSGCGGGGVNSNSTDTKLSSSASSVVPNNTDYSPVVGLYDASVTANNIKDENYLYISSSGKITAYNYLGDSKDLGGNCYRVGLATEVNASINGKSLSLDASNGSYFVQSGSNKISWLVDANKAVTKISIDGVLTSSKITISSGGSTLAVDSKKIVTPDITTITSSICK